MLIASMLGFVVFVVLFCWDQTFDGKSAHLAVAQLFAILWTGAFAVAGLMPR